jgi:hypothetical protein
MPQSIPNLSEEWTSILKNLQDVTYGILISDNPEHTDEVIQEAKAQLVKSLEGRAQEFELSNGSNEGIYPNEVVEAVPTSVIKEIL